MRWAPKAENMQLTTTRLSVRSILTGNVKLASPPELFLKLNEVLENPEADLRDACALIENDPGLSARILRIANSPFFGIPGKVTSLRRALNIVGLQEIQLLVLTTLVIDKFSNFANGLMTMKEFWAKSVRCALTVRLLATYQRYDRCVQTLFLCDLLHEIGRLVVYHRLPELARAAALLARSEKISFQQGERRVIGFDHYQVGAELARLWRLPEIIAATIEHHDAPKNAIGFSREAALVAQAQSFVYSRYAGHDSWDTIVTDTDKLELSLAAGATLAELAQKLDQQFDQIFKLIHPN